MGVVGIFIVTICVFGGYLAAGGHLMVIWQPFEFIIIGGASIGGLIIGNSMSSIKMLMSLSVKSLFAKGPSKKDYLDLLKLLFLLFQSFRKDGPQGVEGHIENPDQSQIFKAYPSVLNNHHAVEFLCDTMKVVLATDLSQYDIDDLLGQDIKVVHEEEHAAQHALQNMADGLPGLGIVAAVLGIIHTMDYLDQGSAKIGALVAAALVGTFLGVLVCYGFVGPIASKIKNDIDLQGRYLDVIRASLVALQRGNPPMVCVEFGRRSIFPNDRPTFEELDVATKESKNAA